MLSEEQEITPALPPLFGAAPHALRARGVPRLRRLVPQGQQVGGPRGELQGAVAGQVGSRRGGAVLPVQAGVAALGRELRAETPFHVAEEILRASGHDARECVAPVEVLQIGDEALVRRRIVPPRAVQQRDVVRVGGRQEHRPIGD